MNHLFSQLHEVFEEQQISIIKSVDQFKHSFFFFTNTIGQFHTNSPHIGTNRKTRLKSPNSNSTIAATGGQNILGLVKKKFNLTLFRSVVSKRNFGRSWEKGRSLGEGPGSWVLGKGAVLGAQWGGARRGRRFFCSLLPEI